MSSASAAWSPRALCLMVAVLAAAAVAATPGADAVAGRDQAGQSKTAPVTVDEEAASIDESPDPATPPATDIFLVDFDASSSPWRIRQVRRVTDRDAYDNQPYFEADGGSLLYTSAQEEQTDVFRYRLADGASERLTETAESEYSPTPIPGGSGFSAVRVEADGTQRLWRFCARGDCAPELVFEEIRPVGYHAWIDSETVALFVLGEPHELVVADRATQDATAVARDVGRALHKVPGREAVSFVDKSDGEFWVITSLELATGAKTRMLQTPPASEDFAWWRERTLLIGHGSKLYAFDLDTSDVWLEVADLSEYEIHGITRLAPSPRGNSLALVAERAPVAATGTSN